MMNIMAQLAILFALCLLGEGVSLLLPFSFPSSIIAMLLLLALLLCGFLKLRHIESLSNFLLRHMAFFFLAPCVGVMEYGATLLPILLPLLLVCLISTPIVYFVTAKTITCLMRLQARFKGRSDD